MDAELYEQIERAQQVLALSRTRPKLVTQKMKKLGVHFVTQHAHADGIMSS